ncbi:MAG: universal stress protein [Chloroflexota bacterium]|nr:universal stress protein [Chloroflexota bacterium]
MRILCCLDGSNSEQMQRAVSTFLNTGASTIGLLYVIDKRPHEEIERQRERFLRGPRITPQRYEQMQQAEGISAQEVLEEAQHSFPDAELLRREGKPEREIVQCAAEWGANLIVISPRSPQNAEPLLGPKSVGHIARFVLDHAPCPVLLMRQQTTASA